MSQHFIIDGYNLVNNPDFAVARKTNYDPRSALLALIQNSRLCGSSNNQVAVVFDGFPPSKGENYEAYGPAVVFSRNISADEKIKKIVEEHGRRKSIIVVSNDRDIQFIVKSLGARVMSVEDFLNPEITEHQKKREQSNPEQKVNYTQAEQINKEMREKWLK